ncbi:MAG TPA: asparagine synthase-related protein, partial [Sumerlaeia bacterium]|nr:asparagine synthase-related protein [Sumerlaeia bacterium]
QYLTFQYCTGAQTLFRGVQRLEAAHNLILKLGEEPRVARYWDVSFEIDEERDEDWFVDRLEALLQDSVRLCLNTDEPIGVNLSGGLDSSTVVCLTRMLLGESAPIKTFTGAYLEGDKYDERPFARLVAKEVNTEYVELIITSRDFADCIERVMYLMDEPAAGVGVFSEYLVAEVASKHAKVVLNGEGGDEFFLGYARYLIAYLEECLKGAIENTADRARYVATLETIVPSLPMLQSYVPMLRNFWAEGLFETPVKRYYRLMDRFADSKAFLNPSLEVDTAKTFEEFRALFESHNAAAMINRIMNVELKTSLAALLHVDDCVSAAWGLDGRSPLLDHRLLELMSSAPPVIKFKNGRLKHLFRQATKNILPKEIRERKDKMGFPCPLGLWIKNDLRDFFHDILLSDRARGRGIFAADAIEAALKSDLGFNRAIWGALCVELWHRQFVDGEAKAFLP